MDPAPTPPPVDPRVVLAAERTLLAWVRTGLALMGFGFVVARFGLFLRELAEARGGPVPEGRGGSAWVGVGLVAFGVLVLAGAGWRHRRYTAALLSGGDPAAPGQGFGLVVTAVLAAGGVGMAVYLLGAM
jgi:putative membrane protein